MNENDLAIAAECLRQIWQTIDAGGTSMGRSREAVWLETAMELIPYDGRFSNIADSLPKRFDDLRAEAKYQKKVAAQDIALGLDP